MEGYILNNLSQVFVSQYFDARKKHGEDNLEAALEGSDILVNEKLAMSYFKEAIACLEANSEKTNYKMMLRENLFADKENNIPHDFSEQVRPSFFS